MTLMCLRSGAASWGWGQRRRMMVFWCATSLWIGVEHVALVGLSIAVVLWDCRWLMSQEVYPGGLCSEAVVLAVEGSYLAVCTSGRGGVAERDGDGDDYGVDDEEQIVCVLRVVQLVKDEDDDDDDDGQHLQQWCRVV